MKTYATNPRFLLASVWRTCDQVLFYCLFFFLASVRYRGEILVQLRGLAGIKEIDDSLCIRIGVTADLIIMFGV